MEATMSRQHSPQSDAGIDEGWGIEAGWLAWKSAGFPGGIGGYGSSHAVAAGSNARGVHLRVGGGGCDEGDGEGGGRRAIILVVRSTTCEKKLEP